MRCVAAFFLALFMPLAAGTCVDYPGFVVDHVYTCGWFGHNEDYCEEIGDSNDGVSPTKACCVCGGGTRVDPTLPACEDVGGWDNGRGSQYDCDWYSDNNDRCGEYSYEGRYNYYPDEACCACGGGNKNGSTPPPPTRDPTRNPTPYPTRGPPIRPPTRAPTGAPTGAPIRPPTRAPTRAPTTAPTRAPTTAPMRVECEDVGGWNNGRGNQYDCDWYADEDGRCDEYDYEGRYGYRPKDACCACRVTNPPDCEDVGGWNNGRGNQYDCDWYADEDGRCDEYDYEGRYGDSPKDACCACGGGNYWARK